jgi:hypothetical protein
VQPVIEIFRSHLCFDAASKSDFKIVVAYEDAAACERAMTVCGQIDEMCGGKVQNASVLFSFGLFGRAQSFKQAAAEAAEADMIIISARGVNELPDSMTDWIETWPRREQAGQAALVFIVDLEYVTNGTQRRLAGYLQRLAGQLGLDFFCNHDHWNRPGSISHRAAQFTRFQLVVGSCPPALENWGIND